MTDQESQSSAAAAGRRRSSFAGIVDMFGPNRKTGASSPPAGTSPFPGPISHAAAQAQQRRLSITTLGLGSSPNAQTPATPFGSLRSRGQSFSSAGSGGVSASASVDESPFEDGETTPPSQTSPFARRVSFGARAMRDMKSGSAGSGGGGGLNANEGFNFAENMRARAERSSISGPGMANGSGSPGTHSKAKSISVMEPPVKEMPPQPRKPDQFQERILKGDFYMD